MKIFLIILLTVIQLVGFCQDSFQTVLEAGQGKVTVKYRNSSNFIEIGKDGQLTGLEYDLLEDFFKWTEGKYDVVLERTYIQEPSFSELYVGIKNSEENGVFGACSFSITKERLKEVKFSPAYMPDIEVMISSDNLPILKDTSEFATLFRNATGITVKGSTFEEDILSLKALSDINLEYVETAENVVEAVQSSLSYYGFAELPNYFSSYQKGIKLNRQNLFIVQREGYGIIYPLNSDWNEPFWEYFSEESNQNRIKEILQKYFGLELINFINEIQASSEAQKKLLMLSKENELETLLADNLQLSLTNEQLDNEKNKAERAMLENKERTLELFIVFGVLSFLLILGVVAYAYYLKNKDHKIIVAQKKEVEIQKDIVVEKHRLITDSIHYAKTIQNAMLQGENHVNPNLPDHFVFFQPKDVVSGDFYWSKIVGDYCYFAAVDCTGHGVPGGFMSVLGISLLNDILFDHDLLTPAEILDKLNLRVIEELDQSLEEGSSKDGMDISLARINLKTLELVWSGAHNSFYIFRQGELTELKANKQPIGFYEYSKPFDNQTFQLMEDDMVYASTDGYPDQFGGERDKKLKSSGFREILMEVQLLSTIEQRKYLKRHFNEWKGDNEQVDDVCVIGMRI